VKKFCVLLVFTVVTAYSVTPFAIARLHVPSDSRFLREALQTFILILTHRGIHSSRSGDVFFGFFI